MKPAPSLPDPNLAIVECEARAIAADRTRELVISPATVAAMAEEIRQWRDLAARGRAPCPSCERLAIVWCRHCDDDE